MNAPRTRQRIAEAPSDAQAWIDLAQQSKAEGKHAETLAGYDRALALRPRDVIIAGVRRLAIASIVPSWHFPMLRDGPRNEAFAAAISRLVKPDQNVLEIGTGSGLLAMLCARAGARQVIACEMVPEIAAAARRVIEANNLADKIRILSKRSQALEVGVDLPEAGDVLVAEIISNNLLSEGVLAAITDARRRLLNSDAIIIPAGAAVRLALVGGDDLDRLVSAGRYGDLDLTQFDRLSPSVLTVPENCVLTPLSLPTDAFIFDFYAQQPFQPQGQRIDMEATASGRCYGVAQWIRLDMGANASFENSPFSPSRSHWAPMIYTFPRPATLAAGDIVRVVAVHDTTSLMVTLEGATTKM